ncbi:D-aminoacyl-tRNA deacylase [Legionella micdadei]|uniref:D-aminoacyl-tRNA deacylase n=1 Tax=Legionella micdadei TaxID=451 RepID=A0A098GIK1_LEGMI|nr:D-aminoacyl-tRNA deacylase [Legionella micdadei]ARG96789.1 D-tyrosyl-tRNA(Tyr) deacylase [Legionella micdadei]ARG99522.1 D-tyrosyl-tRNA(Tyr) deacylase [Legionella micdadei]KTD26460.1 D-tyrosyl-tRNA(Tyr) deacylase [Legionella micdadei]NSL17949.1 D-tyrosyl-tRNA(Tyr) deacylase [Legionella micdadei]CEG61822.1 D-tyrosyl-tRNA(Tyr) deacylase [Legionella micdadei]
MLTVIQRVSEAKVVVNNEIVGEIAHGLMILCGFEKEDTEPTLLRMLEKCLNYRIFDDSQGKMNLSLKEVNGGLLLVPQFTLMADTNKGLRPSFSKAAPPELGQTLFHRLLDLAREKYSQVASGQFGANMKVHLCNNGPVTFLLQF